MNRLVRSIAAVATIVVAGCRTTTVVDEYRAAPVSRLEAGESIVVLGRRHDMHKDTEADYIECVGDKIGAASGVAVVAEQTFVDALYPWFEASTAPMDIASLQTLLGTEAVSRRFSQFNLRYFIWIDGQTETTDSSGGISCAVGPGGGGCFGFKSWDDAAQYEAAIWDLKHSEVAGKVSAESHGTSYLPAVIVPIPLLARVQASACDSMAEQLSRFIESS